MTELGPSSCEAPDADASRQLAGHRKVARGRAARVFRPPTVVLAVTVTLVAVLCMACTDGDAADATGTTEDSRVGTTDAPDEAAVEEARGSSLFAVPPFDAVDAASVEVSLNSDGVPTLTVALPDRAGTLTSLLDAAEALEDLGVAWRTGFCNNGATGTSMLIKGFELLESGPARILIGVSATGLIEGGIAVPTADVLEIPPRKPRSPNSTRCPDEEGRRLERLIYGTG